MTALLALLLVPTSRPHHCALDELHAPWLRFSLAHILTPLLRANSQSFARPQFAAASPGTSVMIYRNFVKAL